MKQRLLLVLCILVLGALITSCDVLMSFLEMEDLEATRVALSVEQTRIAIEQNRLAEAERVVLETEPPVLPTFTPYPTYTQEVVVEAPPEEEPVADAEEPPTEEEQIVEEEEPVVIVQEPTLAVFTEPSQTYEEWLDSVNILLYDDMDQVGEAKIIQTAIEGLGLRNNTTNVGDRMGDLLTNLNSATEWDLIIIGTESRQSISGEYFDFIGDRLDNGAAVIIEIWYIDDITYGRIQPVMQRCGIVFQRDWWREVDGDLNAYLVYLLKPGHPVFSEPNLINGLLIPQNVMWNGDVGDLVKLNPGSSAVLLAGTQPKEYASYGLMAECLDGRMLWQTFSTHDYKTQDMINLWTNYIVYTLKARYDYLQ